MNILFVSHLSGKVSAGPCWSVPARIEAQALVDNVFWINWGAAELEHWTILPSFHRSVDLKCKTISDLPEPFNKPDIVIFEGFYSMRSVRFSKTLIKYNIPYIINPRGSLTYQARNNGSKWKKRVAHLLFFDSFVKNAIAIQYLTLQEKKDSYRYIYDSFILGNGFRIPCVCKKKFSISKINALFIGRIDIYHKGIDLLLEACNLIKDKIRSNNMSIYVYGPLNEETKKLEACISNLGLNDIFHLMGEITGKEKERVILDSDIFILTSRFEGHPMGLIEALSYGLPALVTLGSNMGEEIEESDAGWVSDTTVSGIKSSLEKMISEQDLFVQKSQNALLLSKRYNWNRLALNCHAIIEKLLHNKV